MGKARGSKSLDAYVKALASPHREIVEGLRALVSETTPGLQETINSWGNPVWIGNGDVFWIVTYNGHVDFGFCRGTALNDPRGILEGTGKNFRHVKIRDPREIRSEALKRLMEQAVVLDGKLAPSP